MKLLVPSYYDGFRCAASACPDNCCIGWEICIDGDTLKKYSLVPGPFGERLRKNIKDGSFVLNNERCPFLNERGLCDIIINLGEDFLCGICARHPRFAEQYGDMTEAGLGLACQSAAELILNSALSGYFRETDTDDSSRVFGYIENDDDPELLALFLKMRGLLFSAVENAPSFTVAAASILTASSDFQGQYDRGIIDLPADSERYFSGIKKNVPPKPGLMGRYTEFLRGLEPIGADWSRLICCPSLEKVRPVSDFGRHGRRLLYYFIFRYFLKSFFTGDIYLNTAFGVFSSFYIVQMLSANALGLLGRKYEPREICSLYSKQMEYSQENMDSFFLEAERNPDFSSENLIRLILET